MTFKVSKFGLKLSIVCFMLFTSLSWANNGSKEDSTYNEAMGYFQNEEFEKVVDYLQKSLNKSPNEASYHTLIAHTYDRLNKKAKAKEHYDKAIELNVDDVMAYVGRSLVTENFVEQEYWLNQAIEKFPYRSTAAIALLDSYYISQAMKEKKYGQIEHALRFLNKVKKLHIDYLIRLEETPEHIFQEEFTGFLEQKVNKKDIKNRTEERLKVLDDLEKEWKEKYK